MATKHGKPLEEGQKYGWTAMLSLDGEQWREAYGYLGSYYTSYRSARWEIDFLIRNYPERYKHWFIERIVVDEDGFLHHEHTVIMAMSKFVEREQVAQKPS